MLLTQCLTTVPIRRNLTGNANANGYRTDTERVRERERNGYRTGTERIQNGYRTDIERIRNGNKGKSVLNKRTRSLEHMLVSYAIRVRDQSAHQRFENDTI